jgi:hypothetical protein
MTARPLRGFTAAALAAAFASFAAHAQLFKCVQPDGKTVYQDSACDDKAKQSTVRRPDPGSAPPPAAAADPKATPAGSPAQPAPASGNFIELVSGATVCSDLVPGFYNKYNGAYEKWREKNALLLGTLTLEPQSSQLSDRLRTDRARKQDELLNHCAGIATALQ